jgi:dipeptidyl aminopeptidase/acylaminoacyl peptidase
VSDFRDRFDPLDDLEPPDVLADARGRAPEAPFEPNPSTPRRILVIALAMIVAVAGIGLLFRARTTPGANPATNAPSSPTGSTGTASPSPPTFHGLMAASVVQRGGAGAVIATLQPDGSGYRQITGFATDHDGDRWFTKYDPNGYASDDSPAFSPDGGTIAFIRRYGEAENSLCMIDADGSNFRVVIRDAHAAELSWSPDGGTIAFYSERDGGIHLVDADGGKERPLWQRTSGPNQDSPSWSPDSSHVFFAGEDIWAADVHGNAARRIANPPRYVSWVAVCPEGSPIAFVELEPGGTQSAVWLVDADGRNPRRVTPPGSGDWIGVSWSPNGLRLVIVAADGTVALIDPDGSHLDPIELPSGARASGAVAWWANVP